jgi:hypothetical protein
MSYWDTDGGRYGAELAKQAARMLKRHGINPYSGGTAYAMKQLLHLAAELGDVEMIDVLLEHGFEVDWSFSCEKIPGTTWPPLFYAISGNEVTAVQRLLEAGADVNLPSPVDTTPLMAAVTRGNPRMVECLLKWGADVHKVRNGELNALFIAVRHLHAEVVPVLVEAGVNVNETLPGGTTIMAFLQGHIQQAFIDAGLNVPTEEFHATVVELIVAGSRQWELVPVPCRGIGKALLSVWQQTPEFTREVFLRLSDEQQETVRTVLFCFKRLMKGLVGRCTAMHVLHAVLHSTPHKGKAPAGTRNSARQERLHVAAEGQLAAATGDNNVAFPQPIVKKQAGFWGDNECFAAVFAIAQEMVEETGGAIEPEALARRLRMEPSMAQFLKRYKLEASEMHVICRDAESVVAAQKSYSIMAADIGEYLQQLEIERKKG